MTFSVSSFIMPSSTTATTVPTYPQVPDRHRGLQSSEGPHLLQLGGFIISNAGISKLGSRLIHPPHIFPEDASLVASHEVHKKLKELNIAELLNVGTLQKPRFIIFTKIRTLPYRDGVHENQLPPLESDKWDKWTLRKLVEDLHVDPREITAFKSVLCNNMPHDPDVFGEMSRSQMAAWWGDGLRN